MRISLLGGAYEARSVIANYQRSVNLYPEINPKDSPTPTTHYQRAGLLPLAVPPIPGPGRGIFWSSQQTSYCVVGQQVYQLSSPSPGTLIMSQIGTLSVAGTNPCSFVDNGTTGILVDGSDVGYSIDLANGAFAQIVDGTGTFVGADRVDYIGGFIIFNIPNSNEWGSTLDNSITFDPLYVSTKGSWPDFIRSLIVNRQQLTLLGQQKSESWYNAGNPNFPFAELPGAYFEHGIAAKYSLAAWDISIFFLGEDFAGVGIVFRIRGYECKRISNHALEYQIRLMHYSVGIEDAVGWTYQQDGHVFYVLSFPAGDQTWVFDDSTEQWCQFAWVNPQENPPGPIGNPVLHRHRAVLGCFTQSLNLCQDWENGTIYQNNPQTYVDVVNNEPCPINFIRGFPHMLMGSMNLGQAGLDREISSDGNQITFTKFILDADCGGSAQANPPPQFMLRWSVDRGHTFTNSLLQSAGLPGVYTTQPIWRALGVARDMVFEVWWNWPGECAINGAWVDAKVGTS